MTKFLTAKEVLQGYAAGTRNFASLNLKHIKLSLENLNEINVRDSNLSGAELDGTSLYQSNFSNATLVAASFVDANLYEANLGGAILKDANLFGANLIGANLKGADLTNTCLTHTHLMGADLRETKPPYNSPQFWGELLAQKAETKDQKALACFIAGSHRFNFCWIDFWNWGHPLEQWAIDALMSFSLNLTDCPPKAQRLKDTAARASLASN
jgi:hypothetical protein